MKAAVLKSWIGTGSFEDPFRPSIGAGISFRDITRQEGTELPPEPNVFVAEVEATKKQLAEIGKTAAILYTSDDLKQAHSAETEKAIKDKIGNSVEIGTLNGLSREAAAETLTVSLRTLPKKGR